jgi:flagellin-specific chaperone FliS
LYEDHAEWLTEETERQYLERILELISLLKIEVPEKLAGLLVHNLLSQYKYMFNEIYKNGGKIFSSYITFTIKTEREFATYYRKIVACYLDA